MWHAANRSIQSHTLRKGRGAALLGIAFVFLASSCSQSTPSATLPPSAVSSPTPTTSPPPGLPVPSELWGNWYLPGASVTQVSGDRCPSNPTPTNCFFQLMLGGSTWSISYAALGGIVVPSQGNVVANRNEMDFYNSAYCGLQLPAGLGRFTWRVTTGVLYFTLISDTCSRANVLTNRGWTRTLVAGQPGG
jgi:hypothetical protein